MSRPTYVLGTGLSHDGSACLLKDGRIAVAIEKERLSRKKHDGFNDVEAVQYCLDAEGIRIEDVALVVQNANFSMLRRSNGWFRGPRPFVESARVMTISHHLAHAYSAVGTCPFDETAVLVVDGCGNAYDECLDLDGATIPETPPAGARHLYHEKDSFYAFSEGRLRSVYKDFSPWGYGVREYEMHPDTTMHSIGGVYGAASMYAFFGMDDPGKLMGLAPYGRPGVHDFEIFELVGGRVLVRYDWMDRFDRPARSRSDFKRHFQHYADMAHWIQREVERALLYVVNHRYELAPCENLAYAGGVALNAVANRRILREAKFRNVHIVPAAGDNGLALGCAYYGWLEVLGRERVKHSGSTCLGASYSASRQKEALDAHAEALHVEESEDVAVTTAELLASGKTVGWFQGGSEFGPRALGRRSILADPRDPHVRDRVNRSIKFREDFRPFAPAVTAGDASKFFDCDGESPYMLLVAPIRDEWRDALPAVVHCDGSCRLQTVTADSDPLFHRLLGEFGRIAGLPVLLNTSFNRRGMPIVESPENAISLFLECGLDALVVGRFVVSKRTTTAVALLAGIDRIFGEYLQLRLEKLWPELAAAGGVYRFVVRGERAWTVDLTGARPIVAEARSAEADTIFEMSEACLREVLSAGPGALRASIAAAEIRVSGNPRGIFTLEKILESRP
jgi:carbamoyltransferase